MPDCKDTQYILRLKSGNVELSKLCEIMDWSQEQAHEVIQFVQSRGSCQLAKDSKKVILELSSKLLHSNISHEVTLLK